MSSVLTFSFGIFSLPIGVRTCWWGEETFCKNCIWIYHCISVLVDAMSNKIGKGFCKSGCLPHPYPEFFQCFNIRHFWIYLQKSEHNHCIVSSVPYVSKKKHFGGRATFVNGRCFTLRSGKGYQYHSYPNSTQ